MTKNKTYWIFGEILAEYNLEMRERSILLFRVKGMTLETIGKIYGISRERVRIIEAKAHHKIKFESKFNRRMKKDLEEAIENVITLEYKLNKIKQIVGDGELTTLGLPISGLNLSGRAENVCKRLGVKTTTELERINEKDLLKMKGVGRKTVNEIRFALEAEYFDKRN